MKSEQINELSAALTKVQSKVTGAIKNARNPHFKYDFANLESVWESIRDQMAENGLAVIQTTDFSTEKGFFLTTTLSHSSGQWISGNYILDPVKKDAQGFGGALTYARRYALAAIVGVYQVDDDGQTASMPPTKPEQKHKKRPTQEAPYVFPGGRFQGKQPCEIPKDDLVAYLKDINSAPQIGEATRFMVNKINEYLSTNPEF